MSSNSWNRIPYRQRQAIKSALLARDGLICCICGLPIPSAKAATIEHKIKRRTNRVDPRDLQWLGLAHPRCNYADQYVAPPSRLVDGIDFFEPSTPGHPAPRVVPSPDHLEK